MSDKVKIYHKNINIKLNFTLQNQINKFKSKNRKVISLSTLVLKIFYKQNKFMAHGSNPQPHSDIIVFLQSTHYRLSTWIILTILQYTIKTITAKLVLLNFNKPGAKTQKSKIRNKIKKFF